MNEVQERFDYWRAKDTTMMIQIIMSVVTSEIVGEWRRDELKEGE